MYNNTKRHKINLSKERQDLYIENYKISMKEIKQDVNKGKTSMFIYGRPNIKNFISLIKVINTVLIQFLLTEIEQS
jgi:hypothetical protein